MKKAPAIVIFDRDLRLHDNPALYAAATSGKPLVTVYINDALSKDLRPLGNAQKWWLHHSLESLSESLANKNQTLTLRSGNFQTVLDELIRTTCADAVFWNQSFDPAKISIYQQVQQHLQKRGIAVSVGSGNLLIEPWAIQPAQASYFRVFTPFWHKCLKVLDPVKPYPVPNWIPGPKIASDDISTWKLINSEQSSLLKTYWTPGESGAQHTLSLFTNDKLFDYALLRNRVDLDGSSRLSPYLHWGEISVREVWKQIYQPKENYSPVSVEAFMNEIGFREFSYHLLYHFPQLPFKNFQKKFDRFSWKNDLNGLKKWQQGQTGFPLVDAGMRQLNQSGWMHNRARMVVASFLTKGLLVDWKEGEKWFWDRLVDGDLALNAFNWQWVAGSGVDAAPYFRIFNPTLQAKKFDPHGKYQQHWIPDLFDPSYPKPIIDHAEARLRALEYYKQLKAQDRTFD